MQSLEEFLLEEQKVPAGTRLVVEGRTIYQYTHLPGKGTPEMLLPGNAASPETKTAPSGYCGAQSLPRDGLVGNPGRTCQGWCGTCDWSAGIRVRIRPDSG